VRRLEKKITQIIAIDSKGFIYGSILAKALGCGFVLNLFLYSLDHVKEER